MAPIETIFALSNAALAVDTPMSDAEARAPQSGEAAS